MSNTDKLNRLLANIIEFNTGERLTADKLNALVEILDENLSHISGAIGDIYDENYNTAHRSEGGKQFTSNTKVGGAQKRRFDIANLARLIGPASNLNPQAVGTRTITESIPANTREYTLKHYTFGAITVEIQSYERVYGDFTANSQYRVLDNRKILLSSLSGADLTVTYTAAPSLTNGGPNYQGARFNVYPDPNQVGDDKLQVLYNAPVANANSPTYTITLPTIADQQISLADGTTSELDNRDINHNQQLLLPEWICDLDDNTVLPSYSLYLKNYGTGESYVDAIYTKVDNKTILVSNLNIGNQNCINGFDLRIITVGTDITTSIDDLRNKMYLHSHDGSFGEPPVHIKTLAGIFEGDAPSGVYTPATEDWNPLPNYLHRDGYRSDLSEDVNGKNAMRGNLLMGLTSFDPISNKPIDDASSTSHGVLFGNTNTSIRRINSDLWVSNFNDGIYLAASTINSIGGKAVTINTDSFVVEVDTTASTISLLENYSSNGFSVSPTTHETNVKDLRIVDEKSKLVKTSKNEIKLDVFPEVNFNFTPYENGDYEYIDLIHVIESLNQDAGWYVFKNDLGADNTWINGGTEPAAKSLIETFWNTTPDSSSIELTSFLIRDSYYKLFVFAENTNESYLFKLYKDYPSKRIYSPTFQFDNGRDLRPFDLHINRGATLALNYDSFKADHKYEHEFIVSIDQLFPGAGSWPSSRAPIVSLDYYGAGDQSFAEMEAYGGNPGAETTMEGLDITDIAVSSLPIERVNLQFGVDNVNESMARVIDGSVHIQVGSNVNIGGVEYGVIFFDKLLVKEHIYNNMLFVEVRGFKSDQTGPNDSDLFGKYKSPEIPPSA